MKSRNDCIVAVATPVGTGALCVIRMSGTDTFEVFTKCVREKERFEKSESRKIVIYRILNPEDGETIDEVTAVKYRGPRSYTGEDMVEIISHGGNVCSRQIVALLVRCGSRVADRGEFTMRALVNGKMNIIEAESMHEMISSRSDAGKKRALQNYLGGWEKSVQGWRKALEECLVSLESRIEFGEEDDIVGCDGTRDLDPIKNLDRELDKELRIRMIINKREEGLKVVFGGLRNAGKSSLFNCLLGYERAIVDAGRGTTRDAIREEIEVEGVKVSIVDTAGLGESEDRIELQGMERSEAYIFDADIVFWVSAANEKCEENEKRLIESVLVEVGKTRVIGVINKDDLGAAEEKKRMFGRLEIPYCTTSAVEGKARERLSRFVAEEVRKNSAHLEEGIVVSSRQEGIVIRLSETIKKIMECSDREEVAAEYCREAVEILGELTGESIGETVLKQIFDRFCIGK